MKKRFAAFFFLAFLFPLRVQADETSILKQLQLLNQIPEEQLSEKFPDHSVLLARNSTASRLLKAAIRNSFRCSARNAELPSLRNFFPHLPTRRCCLEASKSQEK